MQPLRHSYTNDTRGDGRVVVKRYQGPDARARRDRMGFAAGVHGQELIEAGLAGPVLRACGHTLRRLHALDPARVLPGRHRRTPTWRRSDTLRDGAGAVLVHGDYGPNNALLDSDGSAVTAVLDWEWAHPGDPVEDLAWCEWIVRMHHAPHVREDAVLTWQQRLEITAGWVE